MSLAVVIKGPEGIVLAADSRVTLQAQQKGRPVPPVNYDNATKLLAFSEPHSNVGAVTYGVAVIGQRTARTAHSYIPEFEVFLKDELEKERKDELDKAIREEKPLLEVEDFARRLSAFYLDRWKKVMPEEWKGPGMVFIVGGYDPGAAYGKVFLLEIPGKPDPDPRNPGENEFGMTWGGQLRVASRLIHGFDPDAIEIIRQTLNIDQSHLEQIRTALTHGLEFPIPYDALPLQDCIDLAIFLIRATMIAQDLAIGVRGVGGPIDVAVITRTGGLRDIQRKVLRGEKE
jgi:hypothetical protein